MNEIELGKAALQHIGVKGMRWGVRKQEFTALGSPSRRQIKDARKTLKRDKKGEALPFGSKERLHTSRVAELSTRGEMAVDLFTDALWTRRMVNIVLDD